MRRLCLSFSRCNIVFTAVLDIMQNWDRHTTRFSTFVTVSVLIVSILFPASLILFIPLHLSTLPSIPSVCVPLSDLADNLAMDDFTFQEQLLTPRLATAGVGGVSSPAAPLWSSSLVPTLPTMLALLLLCRHWPLHTRLWNVTNFLKVPVPDVKFSGSLNEAWRSKKNK